MRGIEKPPSAISRFGRERRLSENVLDVRAFLAFSQMSCLGGEGRGIGPLGMWRAGSFSLEIPEKNRQNLPANRRVFDGGEGVATPQGSPLPTANLVREGKVARRPRGQIPTSSWARGIRPRTLLASYLQSGQEAIQERERGPLRRSTAALTSLGVAVARGSLDFEAEPAAGVSPVIVGG